MEYRPHKHTAQVLIIIGIILQIFALIGGEGKSFYQTLTTPGSIGGKIGEVIGYSFILIIFIIPGLLLYRIKKPIKDK